MPRYLNCPDGEKCMCPRCLKQARQNSIEDMQEREVLEDQDGNETMMGAIFQLASIDMGFPSFLRKLRKVSLN